MASFQPRRLALDSLLALLDTFYPEQCAGCQASPARTPWCACGPVVPGLRHFDRPHLCRNCLQLLANPEPVRQTRRLPDGSELAHLAGIPTSGPLIDLLGAWKYRGIRGLAWPLFQLMTKALDEVAARVEDSPLLVPVPLHQRRRRSRGFNQAAVLARLAASRCGWPVADGVVRRRRGTGQQALLEGAERRWANLAGCFEATPAPSGQGSVVVLVDDVVTSGATCGELALSLRAQGWTVALVLALGLARDQA